MEVNYNETDAAIYAHQNISPEMQKKYTIDQIEYLLDLVYEYYESFETQPEETDVPELAAYINANIKDNYCEPIMPHELFELLEADNLYMESIGLIEPEEGDEGLMYLRELTNEVHDSLSDELKKKYTIADIFGILYSEWEYIDANGDTDETEICKHIQQKAAAEGINIPAEDIEAILHVETEFFEEE
jgi:hypothetical protein